MRFANPAFFLLFIPLVLLIIWKFKKQREVTVLFSDLSRLRKLEDRTGVWMLWLARILRVAVLSLLIVILARPQLVNQESVSKQQGIDIMLALDVSSSMMAEDFLPDNRLVVAKKTLSKFISMRKSDRLGLVVFSYGAFTQVPLTGDYDILKELLNDVDFNIAGEGGTAIGLAVASSINRLKDSEAKSKVIILLTDGENNAGEIDPLSAAQLARTYGIRIYAIGIGKEGGAPIPFIHPTLGKQYQRDRYGNLIKTYLDESLLKKMAAVSQGRYFRATDSKSLETIYEQINALEKTDISVKNYENVFEDYLVYAWVALGLFLLEQLILRVVLRVNP